MKVKFFLTEDLNYPKAESDAVSDGCDLYDLLLSGDLGNLKNVREFEDVVFKRGETWWFNATKVFLEGNNAVIQAAFDMPEEVKISVKSLKYLIDQWKKFLREKTPAVISVD